MPWKLDPSTYAQAQKTLECHWVDKIKFNLEN